MTEADLYAATRVFGEVSVVELPPRGREVGVRGEGGIGGDGRDPRLLAARRGSLRREMPLCGAECPHGTPVWAPGATSAVIGPKVRYERAGLDMTRTSWLPENACTRHHEAMRDAAGVEFILLWGMRATGLWLPDADRRWHGRIGVWGGRWIVMPVMGDVTGDEMEMWRALVAGEVCACMCIAVTCVRCGERCARWDADGVAWCQVHDPKKGKR